MNRERITLRAKRHIVFMLCVWEIMLFGLIFRIFYIQYFKGDEYQILAYEQQTRDRLITPVRGEILDRKGVAI
ncbi:MAG: hypothetical protein ACI4VF_05325, partial [Lachnospirales bacterium]